MDRLKNLSKLLVTRLISRYKMLCEKGTYMHQLFTTVVQDVEDVTDDESRHIWIRTCEILLPEMKKCNHLLPVPDGKPRQTTWLELFLRGMESVHSLQWNMSKDIPSLFNRYWQAIIYNRDIIAPHKHL